MKCREFVTNSFEIMARAFLCPADRIELDDMIAWVDSLSEHIENGVRMTILPMKYVGGEELMIIWKSNGSILPKFFEKNGARFIAIEECDEQIVGLEVVSAGGMLKSERVNDGWRVVFRPNIKGKFIEVMKFLGTFEQRFDEAERLNYETARVSTG